MTRHQRDNNSGSKSAHLNDVFLLAGGRSRVDSFASGTTLAIRRDVVETFGPLELEINEHAVLPLRASLLGEVLNPGVGR